MKEAFMDFVVYNKYSIFNRTSVILCYKHGHFIQFVLVQICYMTEKGVERVFTEKLLVHFAVNYKEKVIHLVKTLHFKVERIK